MRAHTHTHIPTHTRAPRAITRFSTKNYETLDKNFVSVHTLESEKSRGTGAALAHARVKFTLHDSRRASATPINARTPTASFVLACFSLTRPAAVASVPRLIPIRTRSLVWQDFVQFIMLGCPCFRINNSPFLFCISANQKFRCQFAG